jgi:hypothetical protein
MDPNDHETFPQLFSSYQITWNLKNLSAPNHIFVASTSDLKVLEFVSFFSRGQKVSKYSKHCIWSNEKGPSSTTKIVQRNNSERSNATSQCICIQIFLFVIVIVLPICSTCWSFSTSKISRCWRPIIFRLNWQKSAENLNLSTFCHLEKTNRL